MNYNKNLQMVKSNVYLNDLEKNPVPKLHTHWSFPRAAPRPKMPKEYAIATTA